ncbi:MAG TPA: hypothetical protein VJ912_03575 [Candidatus Nanoarchaeia archaeon]|nr:hypothetical protein [Candidatus Nanoarchaeia archaeon]
MVKKRSKKSSKPTEKKDSKLKLQKRFNITLKNLAIFTTALILSFILSSATKGKSIQDIFDFTTIILFFIVVAFLISLLVLGILKQSRKKKEGEEKNNKKSSKKKTSKKKTDKKESKKKSKSKNKTASKKKSSKKKK